MPVTYITWKNTIMTSSCYAGCIYDTLVVYVAGELPAFPDWHPALTKLPRFSYLAVGYSQADK